MRVFLETFVGIFVGGVLISTFFYVFEK